jgi:hypothetical protein
VDVGADRVRARLADVRQPVGQQQHAVQPAGDEVAGDLLRALRPAAVQRGAAAGADAGDQPQEPVAVGGRGARHQRLHLVVEDGEADAVGRGQLAHRERGRVAGVPDLVLPAHRPGPVDDQPEVERRAGRDGLGRRRGDLDEHVEHGRGVRPDRRAEREQFDGGRLHGDFR